MSDSEHANEKKQSKTVKGLADKLQSGWALLAQTCPQCNTPLVREKGGKRMFCVSCDLWVVRESDIDEHTQRQGQQQQQQQEEKKPKEEAVTATGPSHLESGLVSLSDHALFDQTRRELRAENDGEEEEEEEGEEHSSRPNQTAIAAKQRLDEYARARTARASRARAAEEEEFELVAAEAAKADGAALAQHSSRMDSLSAKLGAKMMAGWTLMGDLCPNEQCTCPLMRARGETTNMLCVNCGAKVLKKGDELIITTPPTSVPVGSKTDAAPAAAHATATATAAPAAAASSFRSSTGRRRGGRQTRRQREEEDSSDEDDEEEEEQLLRQAEREEADKVSASLERKAASKAQQPQSQQMSFDIEDPYSLADLPADLSDPVQRSGSGNGASANKSDNVSAKLGEKMLQGYALLGQVCPRDACNCPLVRKRDGPLLCVACGSTIIDEADYDEAVHGPAGNAAGEDGKIAVNPAAAAAAKQQQQSASGRVATPVKRFASPSINDQHDAEHTEKKSRGDGRPVVRISDSPSFQSSASPLVGSPRHGHASQSAGVCGGTGSGSSSGLPSPLQGSRSRAQSECMDMESAEAAIDPRLRQLSNFRSQLGGKSGRFNAPHSRAPSLAASSLLPKLHHTSSAALNAAAHMAFSRGVSEQPHHNLMQPHSQQRSGHSSLEQSPRLPLATPPATPIVAMSLSGHQHFGQGQSHGSMLLPAGMHALHGSAGAAASSSSRYPQSRHPSVNFGSAASFVPAAVPTSLARGSLLHTGSMSPTPFAHAEAAHAAPLSAFAITPAGATGTAAQAAAEDSASDSSLHFAALLSSTHATLLSKLEECRLMMAASTNLAECRELAATMRDMVTTIQHIAQAQQQQQ